MATTQMGSSPDPSKDQYFMSSNEEITRLRINHQVFKHAMNNQLILAPLDLTQTTSPIKILDSATSDGTWLRDYTSSLPDSVQKIATLVGTDLLEAYLPKTTDDSSSNTSTPKFEYFVQDINNPWPESHHSTLDLVHQRLGLAGAAPGTGPTVIARLTSLLKPGGYIQLVESEMIVDDDDRPAMHEFLNVTKTVFQSVGVNPMFVRDEMQSWVEQAGLIHVESRVVDCYFGRKIKGASDKLIEESSWSMEVGMKALIGVLKSFPKLPDGINADDLDTLVARLGKEMRTTGGNFPLRIVWGRKPL